MSRYLNPFRKAATESLATNHDTSDHHDVESKEIDDLNHALKAATLIMDDRIDESDKILQSRNTAFHMLGRGVVIFLKAALGFEQDIMKEAQSRLAAAEAAASAAQNKAKSSSKAWRSEIYEAGTEYLICLTQAQIMSAVVAVMNESLSESMKGFWKMRRAAAVLQQIADMESRFLERKKGNVGNNRAADRVTPSVAENHKASSINQEATKSKHADERTDGSTGSSDDESAVFIGVDEVHAAPAKDSADTPDQVSIRASAVANDDDPLSPYLKHPMDRFAHNTLNTQYGILLLIVSMIPPAFAPILNILGFRGDRTRALAMLWRSAGAEDIQGAIAAQTIAEWYNGLVSSLDIQYKSAWPEARLKELLSHMRNTYPNSSLWWREEARMCTTERDLETSITMLGPGSGTLGAASEKISDKKDAKAERADGNEVANGNSNAKSLTSKRISSLKQVEAIKLFERSLDAMFLHAYDIVSASFLKCVEMNNWSHGLYYYTAGTAEFELYRIYKYGGQLFMPNEQADYSKVCMAHRAPCGSYQTVEIDEEVAKGYKKRATELFEKALPESNKKRIFMRPLPFDVLITRKVQKWQAAAKAKNIDLLDAIGVSPIEEMQLFWAGHGRMRKETMYQCLRRLAFSDGDYSLLEGKIDTNEPQPVDPRTENLGEDDKATLTLLRSVILRKLGYAKQEICFKDMAQARKMLKEQLVDKYEWKSFKTAVGRLGDTWPLPVARYELAATHFLEWMNAHERERSDSIDGFDELLGNSKLDQCSRLLDEVVKWESYDLDVRMGIKISTGRATIEKAKK